MRKTEKTIAITTMLTMLAVSCTATESDITINGETITSSAISQIEEELEKSASEISQALGDIEFKPFDPKVNNDGYEPPANDDEYEIIPPDYVTPPMPDFPSSTPEMTEDGDNPFK